MVTSTTNAFIRRVIETISTLLKPKGFSIQVTLGLRKHCPNLFLQAMLLNIPGWDWRRDDQVLKRIIEYMIDH